MNIGRGTSLIMLFVLEIKYNASIRLIELNLDGKIIEQRIVRKRYLVDLNEKQVFMVKRCFKMERKGNRLRYPNFVTKF